MKIVVTGCNGQLGMELKRLLFDEQEVWFWDVHDLDLVKHDLVLRQIGEVQPDLIINAAAYTAVDKAEVEEDVAFAVNRDGPKNIAKAAKDVGAKLVHVSTDFIFDGHKSSPYLPEDTPNPLSVYGRSKLEGEFAVLDSLGADAVILRTAWVYSAWGNNFVKTMLRLMKERESISVVADQVGTPTWARGLARAVLGIAENSDGGIYHWTDSGIASWYDFALAIQEEAVLARLLDKAIPVVPIRTFEYPTRAHRPAYSVLDKTSAELCLGYKPEHWRTNLKSMVNELN